MARPWAEGSTAIWTYSRRVGTPLAGDRAVTTETMSPTKGSATLTARVAPETAALSAAGPPTSSRKIWISAPCPWAPGPKVTVHNPPWLVAKNGVPVGEAMRTAE